MLAVRSGVPVRVLLSLVAASAFCGPLALAELPDFKPVIRRNQASVVNISTTQDLGAGGAGGRGSPEFGPPGMPPELEEFFRRFRGMPMPGQPEGRREARSLGSGFIISGDGEILTNAHVVEGADSIIVKLSDNSEKPARLIGLDKVSDVALLKIEASGLPAVQLGDSSTVEVGDWVLAIGSPFGLEHSVTQGIVSAIGRSLPDGNYVPFIQTDVAVNPGNSGGPLFNLRGEVVGINSQIYSRSGGYMGLSFAIPVNVASNVARQLAANGRVERGWLGIGIQALNGELAQSFGLDKPTGALVGQVDESGPASRAGLKPGDVILAFNGQALAQHAELPPLVGATAPGTTVTLKIWRDKAVRNVPVTVARLKTAEDGKLADNSPNDQVGGVLNIQVAALTAEQRKESGMESGGVVVLRVADGPAARAGLGRGDIIVSLGARAVENPQQLAALLQKLPRGQPVAMLVQRDKARLFMPLTIGG